MHLNDVYTTSHHALVATASYKVIEDHMLKLCNHPSRLNQNTTKTQFLLQSWFCLVWLERFYDSICYRKVHCIWAKKFIILYIEGRKTVIDLCDSHLGNIFRGCSQVSAVWMSKNDTSGSSKVDVRTSTRTTKCLSSHKWHFVHSG